ncbi:MAG: hypothetical protein EOR68_08195 [Mesorhizobium sp.]|uniref:hypothetical protein n=1 Tax=Mesorhizobium sp. TaxID=1871066 RepID=UPI000FE574D9|nr:hypothetical protein [Mesorhizobium sp.]RWM02078.1 MAG: hypothetical protein EOR68_08195 [Mesorhizobium sp.]
MTLQLPEITYPLAIDTIGKMLALGHGMSVHCHNTGCGQHSSVDMADLCRRLGVDHSCMAADLAPHFRCTKCAGAGRDDKRIGFIQHTPTRQL